MEKLKEKSIRLIIDTAIKGFVKGFELRHNSEVDDPSGTINAKKNNCFISVLGEEFIFYSAFVRSFDSSFGNLLEDIGNQIATFSYKTDKVIHSYILTEQTQYIGSLLDKYEDHICKPSKEHYESFFVVPPKDKTSFKTQHVCDNWFYDEGSKTHYLVELKAGGDLDNKKAKSEKMALLKEYFMLKNIIPNGQKIFIYFATAYNKFGEHNAWHQANVERFFSAEELLIGKDYWNFVCNDEKGFDIVFDQYKISAQYIKDALVRIRNKYGC
ncbi:MAG: TdeIII family type II restriction endonuclease [Clostridia bacterium]|nr:TdeIII family type II restriction endonuclease [Clostridia bacterium]